jgi:hypothetical protein
MIDVERVPDAVLAEKKAVGEVRKRAVYGKRALTATSFSRALA